MLTEKFYLIKYESDAAVQTNDIVEGSWSQVKTGHLKSLGSSFQVYIPARDLFRKTEILLLNGRQVVVKTLIDEYIEKGPTNISELTSLFS